MSSRSIWIIMGLCLAIGVGLWAYRHRTRTLPPIVLKDSEGQEVNFEAMRDGKDYAVLVFLMPGCPISKFALQLANKQHDRWAEKLSFVGLLAGKQPAADQLADKEEVDFPIYGLRDATDPFALNELIDAVGRSEGLRTAVYGGTVVVVDRDRDIVLNLSRDEIRQLPDELADLVD